MIFVSLCWGEKDWFFDIRLELLYFGGSDENISLVLVGVGSSDGYFEVVNFFEEDSFGHDVVFNKLDEFRGPFEFLLDLRAVNNEVIFPDDFSWVTREILFLMEWTSKQQNYLF